MIVRFPAVYLLFLLLVASSLLGQQSGGPWTGSSPTPTNGQCRAPAAIAGVAEAAAESLRKPQPTQAGGKNSTFQKRTMRTPADTSTSTGGESGGAGEQPCNCNDDEPLLLVSVAYLVVVHNARTMNDAVALIRAIRHPQHHVLVHVDAKARDWVDNSTLRSELDACGRCFASARMESVYDVKWSHWSMNLPTIWGMQQLLERDGWDVFINLSGDTMPCYRPRPLAERLDCFRYNFVTSSSCSTGLRPTSVYEFPSFWHKRAHYTNRDKEPDPVFVHSTSSSATGHGATRSHDEPQQEQQSTAMVTHFGSQWMILQRSFVEWLVSELDRNDSLPSQYRDYLVESGMLMTDETYFPSLVVSQFPNTLPRTDDQGFLVRSASSGRASLAATAEDFPLPSEFGNISDVRYERMDEHVPTAFGELWGDQRLTVPANSSLVEPERPWGPYHLSVYDLGNVRESGAWFVRKVSSLMDDNLQRLLPVDRRDEIPRIYWPTHEIALHEKPDWTRKFAEWRKRAAEREGTRDASVLEESNRSMDEAEEEEL